MMPQKHMGWQQQHRSTGVSPRILHPQHSMWDCPCSMDLASNTTEMLLLLGVGEAGDWPQDFVFSCTPLASKLQPCTKSKERKKQEVRTQFHWWELQVELCASICSEPAELKEITASRRMTNPKQSTDCSSNS